MSDMTEKTLDIQIKEGFFHEDFADDFLQKTDRKFGAEAASDEYLARLQGLRQECEES